MQTPPRKAIAISLLVLGSTVTAGCGKQKEPETQDDADVEVDNSDEFDDGMGMMQEYGGMNEEKVNKTVERLVPELAGCLRSAGEEQDYLFGDVSFKVKVNRQGGAEFAQVTSSNLGSYTAESCMLDVLRRSRWPKPVDGYFGLVTYGPMGYDAPEDVRPPVEWTPADVEETLSDEENATALGECGSGGPFNITAYVDTDGSVLSVGISHTDENGDSVAACLVEAIEEMTFPSPGSWRAKVTFRH